MEQKINTRGIIESALMAGIITIILMATLYLPLMYIVGVVILPIPVAVLYYRHEFKYVAGCIVVSIAITSMFSNPIIAISSSISYSLVGGTIGYCIKNKKKPYKTLILVILASIISFIGEAWLVARLINNTNLFGFIREQLVMYSETMNAAMESAKSFYSSMGMSATQLQMLDQAASIFTVEAFIIYLPAVILLYGFLVSYICFGITRKILIKLRYKDIETLNFSEFYVSNLLGAALISIISIGIIVNSRGVEWALLLYNATMLVTMVLMAINGVAVTNYFLTKKMNMNKSPRTFMIVIIFILGSYIIFSIIGFVEMILDFRKLDPHRLRKA
ncbi:DUF2232 domain-containing protein [Clostridium sp.]|uniref:DUF2232 domain-containing protein n=1 Tax=Clostridium sp. TaxID=1506 RepID=UPI003217D75D